MNRAIVALSIVLVAGLLVRAIAIRKNEELAGVATYRLPQQPGIERDALERVLASLENFEQTKVARDLRRLDTEGALWVAPYLPSERQAVFVDSPMGHRIGDPQRERRRQGRGGRSTVLARGIGISASG